MFRDLFTSGPARRALGFLLALMLSACSVGPDYEPPAPALPKTWQNALQQPELPKSNVLSTYWQALDDQSLNSLIETALEASPSLAEATLRLEEALANYRVQRGEYFPDIDLSSTVQKRRRSAAVASAISGLNNDFISLGGVLNWEIDVLGRIRRLSESAEALVEASEEDVHASQVSLIAEVALAYVSLRTLQSQIALTESNIRTQRESLELAKERFQAGVAPELDVEQAESNLGETQAALPRLWIDAGRTLHRLAVLTGQFPDELKQSLQVSGSIPEIPRLDQAELPLNVIRQRPDIRRVERELAAQHALIGAAEAQLYPIVSLPGSFSFEALNTLEDAFKRNSLAYSVGPRVSWNFLDFGRIRGNIAAQDFRSQQVLKRYEQNVLVAVQEVEDAMLSLQEERRRTEYLSASVEASRKSVELVRSLYVSGLTDFQNVLVSERRLFEQEITLAQSTGNAVQAYVSLFRALGGGWSREEFEDESRTKN